MSEKDENKKNQNNKIDIEVVIGDDSELNISEVGDMMNDLRPKDSAKNKKEIIIPIAKKNIDKKEETTNENEENNDEEN